MHMSALFGPHAGRTWGEYVLQELAPALAHHRMTV